MRPPSATSMGTGSPTSRSPVAGASSISVLLGNGAGGLGNGRELTWPDSRRTQSSSRDFDRDGRIDLAVANSMANTVSVLRRRGQRDVRSACELRRRRRARTRFGRATSTATGSLDLVTGERRRRQRQRPARRQRRARSAPASTLRPGSVPKGIAVGGFQRGRKAATSSRPTRRATTRPAHQPRR